MNQMAPLIKPVADGVSHPAFPGATNLAEIPTQSRRGEGAAGRALSDRSHPDSGQSRGRWWQTGDYEWLLVLRFALANAFALACLVAAWSVGYVDMVWAADTSRVSVVIAAVFAMSWLFACRAAVEISRDLNRVRRRDDSFPREPADNLKERLSRRVAIVRHTANTLVLLGLIGTVLGFITALSGVKPSDAGDASAIAPMVATMIHGMSIALYTTLVGSVLALWLSVLHRILVSAASNLMCAARVAGYA